MRSDFSRAGSMVGIYAAVDLVTSVDQTEVKGAARCLVGVSVRVKFGCSAIKGEQIFSAKENSRKGAVFYPQKPGRL